MEGRNAVPRAPRGLRESFVAPIPVLPAIAGFLSNRCKAEIGLTVKLSLSFRIAMVI